MTDPRNKKLAKILADYSVQVKSNDKVKIVASNSEALPLVEEIYKLVLKKGAFPSVDFGAPRLSYLFYKHAQRKHLLKEPEISLFEVKWADKFIFIGSPLNTKELTNIDPKKLSLRDKATKKISDIRLKKDWVITYYPTNAMAQDAEMALEELEDFCFRAMLQDWNKVSRDLKKLKAVMDKGKKVHIVGKETDLTLDLTGREAEACVGDKNMPDGEVFACPLEDSVNGKIYYDLPSVYGGKEVQGIRLEFKNGRVVKFSASKNEDYLKAMLETDPGAKRLGEFAIAANYGIKKPIKNGLYDEKIGGTIHTALGQALDKPTKPGGGKNDSAIHWDLIKDMRFKGSRVEIDGKPLLVGGKLRV